MASNTDPLVLLPAEIVLRILEFTPTSSLASLTRLTKSWHAFIDYDHQKTLYANPDRTPHTPGSSYTDSATHSLSYSKYFSNPPIDSWKELCRRQHLLDNAWKRESPITRESTLQVGNSPIWRFKPDFKRRIFLSTSQMGGLNVTDMDSGRLLWSLDTETVRPFAHLEYQDGTAVWDREGDAVEVWRTEEGMARGQFKQIAILPHDRQTRGFQLSYDTLCVVSSQGKGYVYSNVAYGTPTLATEIDIPNGAVGHLDQGHDTVVYSLGAAGYDFYEKASGKSLGTLDPKECTQFMHILHPTSPLDCKLGINSMARSGDAYPPMYPGKERTTPLTIIQGPLPRQPGGESLLLSDDEWGAGMLNGDMFVGVSRGGRVFICPDWRKALDDKAFLSSECTLIECDSDGSTFDLGGWLSVRNHRVMVETQDRVYVIGLTDSNHAAPSTDRASPTPQPSFAFATSSAAQLAVPVSFMAIYDDCIMSTYTTLRYRQRLEVEVAGEPQTRTRILPTKIIRVLSLAPDLEAIDAYHPSCGSFFADEALPGPRSEVDGFGVSGVGVAEADTDRVGAAGEAARIPEMNAMRADLYTLISMLEGEPEIEEDLDVEVPEGEDVDLEEWLTENGSQADNELERQD